MTRLLTCAVLALALTGCSGTLREIVGPVVGTAICNGPIGQQVEIDLRQATEGRSVYAGLVADTAFEIGAMLCANKGYTISEVRGE